MPPKKSMKMLESLKTEKIELACVGVVNVSRSTAKFDKQQKKLEKLKDQRSKTAGLETVSVGCKVMLRHNIDVTVGLANGPLRIVMGNYATIISIKFDHNDVPCDKERVTSRFMLSKNLYIHRKQFSLYTFLCYYYT
uniref:ATP-dependent DNA helicase n=1 Tax=Amphimedon queenslandica TaxID=400682 RepID=A0A1X7UPY0_AMPQE